MTPDHVNPEAPWPHLDSTRTRDQSGGQGARRAPRDLSGLRRELTERWVDPAIAHGAAAARSTATASRAPTIGRRVCTDELPSADLALTRASAARRFEQRGPRILIERPRAATRLTRKKSCDCSERAGSDFSAVCAAADELRQRVNGDIVSYVVNRNINYTNICGYHCQFCAFSKGKTSENLRGKPYDLPLDEIQRRAREAWERGATEVCMQGGIHPAYTGETILISAAR